MKKAAKNTTSDNDRKQISYRADATTHAQMKLFAKRHDMSLHQFIQMAVDRAVIQEADATGIDWEPYTQHPDVPGWVECLLYGVRGMKLDNDEQARKSFVARFRDFFYLAGKPNHRTLEILWPNLSRYMAAWADEKDEGVVRQAMASDLDAAKMPVPKEWREPRPADWRPGNEGDGQRNHQDH